MHDKLREEIADATREATAAGVDRPGGARDRRRSSRRAAAQELDIEQQAATRLAATTARRSTG